MHQAVQVIRPAVCHAAVDSMPPLSRDPVTTAAPASARVRAEPSVRQPGPVGNDVEHQTLVRTGFRMILNDEADMDVVADVGDGDAAVAAVRRTRPDIVLMDIACPS